MRLVTILSACAVACAASTGIMSPASAQKAGIIKIGVDESLSGNYVSVGLPSTTAVKLAAKEINEKGGFKIGDTTYTLEVLAEDNQSTTAGAIATMTKLVEDQNVKFVFGPTLATFASQTELLTVPANVIHFSPSSGWQVGGDLSDPKKPLLFGTQMPVNRVGEIDASAFKELKATKVAIITQDDDNAKPTVPPVVNALKAAGIQSVTILFPPGTADFSPYVTRAKSEGADAVYYLFPQAYAPQVLRYVVDLQAAPKGLGTRQVDPVIALKPQSGQPLNIPFFTTNNTPSLQYPPNERVKTFAAKLLAMEPKIAGPTFTFAFFYYDFVPMLVEAMKRAGTVDDTAKIGAALKDMTYDGIAGKICFGKSVRTAMLDGGVLFVANSKVTAKTISSTCQ